MRLTRFLAMSTTLNDTTCLFEPPGMGVVIGIATERINLPFLTGAVRPGAVVIMSQLPSTVVTLQDTCCHRKPMRVRLSVVLVVTLMMAVAVTDVLLLLLCSSSSLTQPANLALLLLLLTKVMPLLLLLLHMLLLQPGAEVLPVTAKFSSCRERASWKRPLAMAANTEIATSCMWQHSGCSEQLMKV